MVELQNNCRITLYIQNLIVTAEISQDKIIKRNETVYREEWGTAVQNRKCTDYSETLVKKKVFV